MWVRLTTQINRAIYIFLDSLCLQRVFSPADFENIIGQNSCQIRLMKEAIFYLINMSK